MKKKLPIGIEHFEKLHREDFYYVDKTFLLKDFLENWSEVNLFSRPRKFGKSLTLSMMQSFFEYGRDTSCFEGLSICKETKLCEQYMGKFPVIFLSLKDMVGRDFSETKNQLRTIIGTEALRFDFLKESKKLSSDDFWQYEQMIHPNQTTIYGMSDDLMTNSLFLLSRLLYQHYETPVILLIDEYDVPLDQAYRNGYYDEMEHLLSKMFGAVLKGNPYLQFAVLMGCLQITRESVFAGINHIHVLPSHDPLYQSYFGFTKEEVLDMLSYYELKDAWENIDTWYGGYLFGSTSLYCPWDILNALFLLKQKKDTAWEPFWLRTSSNDLFIKFIRNTGIEHPGEIEKLLSDEAVFKPLDYRLTYRDLNNLSDHYWSLLYATGYLTIQPQEKNRESALKIPNRSIYQLLMDQTLDMFRSSIRVDHARLMRFCQAFPAEDTETIQEMFQEYLLKLPIRISA